MKNILGNILDKGVFVLGLALGGGILAMVGFVQVYNWLWAEPEAEAVAENPVERALSGGEVEGPVKTLPIRHLLGPFLSKDDGREIGFVFLEVEVDIAGEANYETAEEKIDELVMGFTQAMKMTGVGRADLPGEVDYPRLAKTFLSVAREEVSLKGITSIRVSEDND